MLVVTVLWYRQGFVMVYEGRALPTRCRGWVQSASRGSVTKSLSSWSIYFSKSTVVQCENAADEQTVFDVVCPAVFCYFRSQNLGEYINPSFVHVANVKYSFDVEIHRNAIEFQLAIFHTPVLPFTSSWRHQWLRAMCLWYLILWTINWILTFAKTEKIDCIWCSKNPQCSVCEFSAYIRISLSFYWRYCCFYISIIAFYWLI